MNPSPPLLELALAASGRAIGSLDNGTPLIPFAMAENTRGERAYEAFPADSLASSRANARAAASRLSRGIQRVIVAYEGEAVVDGEAYDALFLEAHERGAPTLLLAQLFARRRRGARPLGDLAVFGQTDPLLRP